MQTWCLVVLSDYVSCVWPIMSDVLKICSSFVCTIAINLVVTRLSWHGDSQATWWLMLRPRSTRPCPVCHCRSGYSRGLWCGVEILIWYTLHLHTLTYLGYPEPCVGRGSVTYWYDKYTRCALHYVLCTHTINCSYSFYKTQPARHRRSLYLSCLNRLYRGSIDSWEEGSN